MEGVDAASQEINVAKKAADILGVKVNFSVGHAFSGAGHYDVIICLSVWKWVAWKQGSEAANHMVVSQSRRCDTYVFESGVSDAGTDLGVKVRHTEIPMLLARNTSKDDLEMLGVITDPKYNIRREFWKVW